GVQVQRGEEELAHAIAETRSAVWSSRAEARSAEVEGPPSRRRSCVQCSAEKGVPRLASLARDDNGAACATHAIARRSPSVSRASAAHSATMVVTPKRLAPIPSPVSGLKYSRKPERATRSVVRSTR